MAVFGEPKTYNSQGHKFGQDMQPKRNRFIGSSDQHNNQTRLVIRQNSLFHSQVSRFYTKLKSRKQL